MGFTATTLELFRIMENRAILVVGLKEENGHEVEKFAISKQ